MPATKYKKNCFESLKDRIKQEHINKLDLSTFN